MSEARDEYLGRAGLDVLDLDGNERQDGLADQLLSAVAEEGLGLPIGHDDETVTVHREHRVGRGVEEFNQNLVS